MSRFSDLLSHYIEESGMTIKYLSESSGFEATHITKFKNGSRKPVNQKRLEALIDALQIAPSDREKLFNAYYIDHIGEEKYKEYEAAISLIESGDQIPFVPVSSIYQHDLSRISVVQQYSNVINVMTKVIEQACSMKDGAIYIMAQPDNKAMVDLLLRIVMGHPEITIHHILSLCTAQKGPESVTYNLGCAQQMLALMRNSTHYFPYYYYEKHPIQCDNELLFPNVIITDRYVMTISNDYSNGLLLSDEKVVSHYRGLFQKQEAASKSFGKTYMTLIDTMRLYASLYEECDQKPAIYLTYQPCVLMFVKEEYFNDIKVRMDSDQIFRYFFTEYQHIVKQLDFIDCFSIEGLYEFWRNGIIIYARDLVNPLSPEFRNKIIRDMLAAAKKGEYSMRILKPETIRIPKSLTACCSNSKRALIEFSFPDDTASSLAFSEPGINNTLTEFLRFIPNSHWVYSQEESIQIIQSLLD